MFPIKSPEAKLVGFILIMNFLNEAKIADPDGIMAETLLLLGGIEDHRIIVTQKKKRAYRLPKILLRDL